MINHMEHIEDVIEAELTRLKLGDKVGYTLCGPTLVPGRTGQLEMGWHMMVTIAHNVLLNQNDVGISVPVVGLLPPDEIFKKGVEYLLDEARKERHRLSTVEPDVLEGSVVPPGQGLPPGLQGMRLGGPEG